MPGLNHLKINLTVGDSGHVYGTAKAFADLACHIQADRVDLEITVTPGKLPGEVVSQEQLDALGEKIKALKGSVQTFDQSIPPPPG